ncbi:MAG: redoxin domain-containing protein [Limisphaerales bacterium]
MKTLCQLAALAAAFLVLNVHAAPKVGDPAPDFTLQASDGKTYQLSSFRGKQAVVIAWFPKAFTGGCTAECKSLRENGSQISGTGAAVFAASVDDVGTNKKFAESLGLDYPILSDPSKETAKAYGVLNPANNLAQRWTFFIGRDGKLLAIDQAVQPSSHGTAVAERLKTLGGK